MNARRIGGSVVAAIALMTGAAPEPARACTLQHYADDGRYVGGDLIAQVVAKADLIQIVRVTQRRIVTRYYTLGDWYLQFGETEVPGDQPEHIDHFVFTLESVDTLKGELEEEPWLLEDPLRVLGYDFSLFEGGAYPASLEALRHPNSLPEWVFDRPADRGYVFIGASEEAGLGGGECFRPYFLELGQLFIAFRRSDGRLYPPGGGFPLEIDVELSTEDGGRRRETLNMQSLIPIPSPDAPLVSRLRGAVAGSTRATMD